MFTSPVKQIARQGRGAFEFNVRFLKIEVLLSGLLNALGDVGSQEGRLLILRHPFRIVFDEPESSDDR